MRYFLVVFITESKKARVAGNLMVTSERFPSRKIIRDNAAEIAECAPSEIAITNIIELNEQDYNDFVK